MKEGDILLAPLQQSDGRIKNRPVVVLRKMPGFGDLLVCGVSSQLRQEVLGFDEKIDASAADFQSSGLKSASIVRLSFLATLPSHIFYY